MMGTHLYSTRQLDFSPQRKLHPSPIENRVDRDDPCPTVGTVPDPKQQTIKLEVEDL